MKKKENTKQRLFEVMSNLDSSFKPKLNEDYNDYLDTNYSADGLGDAAYEDAVNDGMDVIYKIYNSIVDGMNIANGLKNYTNVFKQDDLDLLIKLRDRMKIKLEKEDYL